MPKLYRRSWERQETGRNGQISNPLPKRSGTDGVVSGASLSLPEGLGTAVHVLTSATANFMESDVGRLIRIENTPNQRYNWTYIIDSINSPTSVNLRTNHSLPDTPVSWARFFEDGTAIAWTILPSATFTADAPGDIAYWFAGSYLTIETSELPPERNLGQWRITHRIDDQSCLISKSHIFYPTNHGSAPDTQFFYRDDAFDFQVETGMRWYICDREALNAPDMWTLSVQAYMDMGWVLFQQRGWSPALRVVQDWILFSSGESDPAIEGGKSMYLRFVIGHHGTLSVPGVWDSQTIGFALFPFWDPTLTNGLPGDGGPGLRLDTYSAYANPSHISYYSQGGWGWGSSDSYGKGRHGGYALNQIAADWWAFGDRDEVVLAADRSSVNAQQFLCAISYLKPLNTINPNVMALKVPVSPGSNVVLNVGASNPRTRGYEVGDNITIIGYKAGLAAAREFVETTTITKIDTTDPANCKITVDVLTLPFGHGPGDIKAHVGADPLPLCGGFGGSGLNYYYIHNTSRLAQAGSGDYDKNALGRAISANWYGAASKHTDPNRKTGRYAITPLRLDYEDTETRGTFRYLQRITAWQVTRGAKLVTREGEVYANILPFDTTTSWVVGPMSKAMAGIR